MKNICILICLIGQLSLTSFSAYGQVLGIDNIQTVTLCPDSTVLSWGRGIHGDGNPLQITQQPITVLDSNANAPLDGITYLTASSGSSFALAADSTVWVWGFNSLGQLGIGNATAQVSPLKLKGPGGIGIMDSVVAISAYSRSAFALRANGTVFGWGSNTTGVLGDGTNFNVRLNPVQVIEQGSMVPLDSIVAIDKSPEHGLALDRDGTVWAWGADYSGELGQITNLGFSLGALKVKAPTGPGVFDQVTAVAAGTIFSVGLREDGTVWTWGDNDYGQLGDGTFLNISRPLQVRSPSGQGFLENIAAIAAGDDHALAMDSLGRVYVWGSNEYGQLGVAFNGKRSNLPLLITGIPKAKDVYAGRDVSGIITADDELYLWGRNFFGNLGNGRQMRFVTHPRPVLSPNGQTPFNGIKQLSSGYESQYVLRNTGTVYRWGENAINAPVSILEPSRTSALPVAVPDTAQLGILSGIQQISASLSHALYLDQNGVVYGSGFTSNSKLGPQSFTARLYPFPIRYFNGELLDGVRAVEASNRLSVFLMEDSTVRWIGQMNNTSRTWPFVQRDSTGQDTIRNITAVATTVDLFFMLDADSTVWGYGRNLNGEVGDGTTTQRSRPVHVRDSSGVFLLKKIVAIDTEEGVSLALDAQGHVWAWGNNDQGQHGIGNTSATLLPRLVQDSAGQGPLSNIVAIAAGELHCLALAADSTVWAWGLNVFGNLGDGTDSARLSPVHVRNADGTLLRNVVGIETGTLLSSFLLANGTAFSCGHNEEGQTGSFPSLGEDIPQQAMADCRSFEPEAQFSTSQTAACESICVQFTDSSLFSPQAWAWEFPGGSPVTSADPNPQVCYSVPGTYAVRLVVSNAQGQDSLVKDSLITVFGLPQADAGVDIHACVGDSVTLSGSGGLTYQWSGSNALSCLACPAPSFLASEDLDLALTVVDANGCQATDSVSIEVQALTTADFSFTLDSAAFQVSLQNLSTDADAYFWDFGDGNTDSIANPVHTYGTDGTYQVCLVTFNDCGTDTLCQSFTLEPLTALPMTHGAFEVYPNPSDGNLRLILPAGFGKGEL
ncbi:MAG: PKD domain-containing protein [Bacteroidota bacterium]